AVDDGDRSHHRSHRGAHVLPHLSARREHPLSAAPQNLTALALLAAEKVATEAPVLEECLIARAMAQAGESGESAWEVLARESGLSGGDYAHALAIAFDYRYVDADELALMEPDFAKLAPAEATR